MSLSSAVLTTPAARTMKQSEVYDMDNVFNFSLAGDCMLVTWYCYVSLDLDLRVVAAFGDPKPGRRMM